MSVNASRTRTASRLMAQWCRDRRAVLGAVGVIASLMMAFGAAPAGAATQSSRSGAQGAVSVLAEGRAISVSPDGAGGCSKSVCIEVTGEAGYVAAVTAEGFHGSKPGCADGELYVNSKRIKLYGPICYNDSGGGVLIAAWGLNKVYGNGTTICVAFTGKNAPSGKPCESIES